ncbi:oxidoreductase-like protein [Podospora conica]|nr:oxidoreductase-like protein [Schizothecium conicum]
MIGDLASVILDHTPTMIDVLLAILATVLLGNTPTMTDVYVSIWGSINVGPAPIMFLAAVAILLCWTSWVVYLWEHPLFPTSTTVQGVFILAAAASAIPLWKYCLSHAGVGPQHVMKTIDTELGKHVHTCIVPIFDYELVVTRDPYNVRAMLATQAADWDIGENRAESWRPLVGSGVFTSRGDEWKHSRAMVRPQFAKDQINDLDLFERHVQELFAHLERLPCKEGGWKQPLDIQPLFYRLTLDITTELIYGCSAHSLNPSKRITLPAELTTYEAPDGDEIGAHMDGGKWWVEARGALWKYRWLLPNWWFKAHCTAVHKYAQWFVDVRLKLGDDYLAMLESKGCAPSRGRFVLLDDLAKTTQDPVQLRSQTLNILTAGRDTTAALISWIFYFLARDATILGKLRRQVIEQFGSDSGEAITAKGLRDGVPYLTAVINETLRVAPVIPLNERVAVRDTVLPRGGGDGSKPMFVPKGRQVLIATYAMAMREDIWGDDADEYRPERWEEMDGRRVGFEFTPFGGGARQCLGQQFARTMAAYVVVRMLQRYVKIQSAEPTSAPMRFHHTIENRSGSGVQGHKLLIIGGIHPDPSALDALRTRFPDLQIVSHTEHFGRSDPPFPLEDWKDVTLAVSFLTLPKKRDDAPNLKYVQLMSAGANHILEDPFFKNTDTMFCTANGVHGPQIAEWIVMTYLAFEHSLPQHLEDQKKAVWNRTRLLTSFPEDAVSKTVGILGYGSIGRQTARLATAMGMKVHAYTLHPRPTPESRRDAAWSPAGLGDPDGTFPSQWFSGGSTEDLHAFLRSGLDLLVVATPLTNGTQHLLAKREFEVLAEAGKGRTYVSNVARGPVIHTGDVIDALEGGLIRGAALDVTDPEPLPNGHALWGAKNVIVTPHVSGASTAYGNRVLGILQHNLERLVEGKGLVNLVDKERGY